LILYENEAFATFLVMTMGCVIARRYDVAICLFLVLIMRLPRLSFLFARNDFRMRHCEEARRGNLLVSQFQFKRLLRSYFPRNDFRMRHCEEARRGNLFVSHFQFMRLLRSCFPHNDRYLFLSNKKNQYYFITVVLVLCFLKSTANAVFN
jgi:hypothetical protein